MRTSFPPITPVILSGGSGTRLWPLSRAERPKQFIPLTADVSMLQLTLGRTMGLNCSRPIIVGSVAHTALVAAQAPEDAWIILEPCARNTAPAIALAALVIDDPDTALLVMPSDHVIEDVGAFHKAISDAMPAVKAGWLVTLGIEPDGPETGYGYIAIEEAITDNVHRVARFIEKPDLVKAEALLAEGNHVWNAGIFLFRADKYLQALEQLQPEMLRAVETSVKMGQWSGTTFTPDRTHFEACPSDSIDYAIIERSEQVACVPVTMGWSDVGSWDALHNIAAKDDAGNASDAFVTLIEARNCLVRSDGPRISLLGVEDLIVVATRDQVLVVPRGKSQLVRKAAELAKRTVIETAVAAE